MGKQMEIMSAPLTKEQHALIDRLVKRGVVKTRAAAVRYIIDDYIKSRKAARGGKPIAN